MSEGLSDAGRGSLVVSDGMLDKERLETIRKKIGAGRAGGAMEGITFEEAEFLLEFAASLEKKNAVLSRHVLELTEELENVKMDFGGGGSR